MDHLDLITMVNNMWNAVGKIIVMAAVKPGQKALQNYMA